MPVIDLILPVDGTTLPTDHMYSLYSALSRIVAAFHGPGHDVRFGPVPGTYVGNGLLRLDERSRLRCRLPAEQIATVLPLAGRQLDVATHCIRLGVPCVAALVPSAALAAKVVTFKNSVDVSQFLEVARLRLRELGVQGTVDVPLIPAGPRKGEPRRQVVRVKGKRVVGFACLVNSLSPEDSVRLQEEGLGGRRRMGCGFFVPIRQASDQ